MMTEKSETPSLLLTQLSLDVNRALSGQRLLYNTPEGLRVKELYERAEKAEAEADNQFKYAGRLLEQTYVLETRVKELEAEAAALRKVFDVAEKLNFESEEYDFDDGMGRGAPQGLWDDLDKAIDAAKEKK